MIKPVSCVLLAGGQSKRMGKDKAFLTLNGKTFLQIITEKLSKKCNEIILSVNKDEEIYREHLKEFNFKIVKDLNPYEGPLNGISSVYSYISNDFVFIATCDTPLINENLVNFYLEKIGNYDAIVPVIDGKIQPLNTLYTKNAVLKAKDLYGKVKSLKGWIENLSVLFLNQNELEKIDKGLWSYKSINTPDQYEELLRKFHQKI
jgi:molybdopterin-guanine dinucleotide biosynthesis protein A